MAVSQAQKLAKAKYQHEKRSIVAAEVSKEKGAEYRAKAAELGMSLSLLIQRGVESYGTVGGEVSVPRADEKLSAEQRRLLDEFGKLPADAQKHFMKAFSAINSSKGGGDNGDN